MGSKVDSSYRLGDYRVHFEAKTSRGNLSINQEEWNRYRDHRLRHGEQGLFLMIFWLPRGPLAVFPVLKFDKISVQEQQTLFT